MSDMKFGNTYKGQKGEATEQYQRGYDAGVQGYRDQDTRMYHYHLALTDSNYSDAYLQGWADTRKQVTANKSA